MIKYGDFRPKESVSDDDFSKKAEFVDDKKNKVSHIKKEGFKKIEETDENRRRK